jgi:hypothetical protein
MKRTLIVAQVVSVFVLLPSLTIAQSTPSDDTSLMLPDRPAFIFEPADIGPEPQCDGLSGIDLRICKVQLRSWRILERQIKWQKRQEERQAKFERTIGDIIQLLRQKSTSGQLRARTQQVERAQGPSARATSIRGIRANTYKGYIRPTRACRSVPLRERDACMKGLTM